MLVSFGILLFQAGDVLAQFLEHFFLKPALWLAGIERSICRLDCPTIFYRAVIKLEFLCGVGRVQDISSGVGALAEYTFRRSSLNHGGHVGKISQSGMWARKTCCESQTGSRVWSGEGVSWGWGLMSRKVALRVGGRVGGVHVPPSFTGNMTNSRPDVSPAVQPSPPMIRRSQRNDLDFAQKCPSNV
jgi:hypothetical protein